MNRDKKFVRVEEMRLKIEKSKLDLSTKISRYQTAKARFLASEEIYRQADVMYSTREDTKRRYLYNKLALNPGFRTSLARNVLAAVDKRRLEHEEYLCIALTRLDEAKVKLQEAITVVQVAKACLTSQFADLYSNVPHIVDKIAMTLNGLVEENELEYAERRRNVFCVRNCLADLQKREVSYIEDFAGCLQNEKRIIEIRLRHEREKAWHEKMRAAALEAMASARSCVQKIKDNILEMELEVQRLTGKSLKFINRFVCEN